MSLSTHQIRLLAAFAGINVVLVVGGWMALVSPQRTDAANAVTAAAAAQAQLDKLLGENAGGPTKQPAIHTAGLYSLDTALPAQPDQPDLLLELDALARSAGVQLLSVSPQAAQANTAGYTVVPINLSVNGSYFGVTRYLQLLRLLVSEKNGRLVANGPLFAVTGASLTAPSGSQHAAP